MPSIIAGYPVRAVSAAGATSVLSPAFSTTTECAVLVCVHGKLQASLPSSYSVTADGLDLQPIAGAMATDGSPDYQFTAWYRADSPASLSNKVVTLSVAGATGILGIEVLCLTDAGLIGAVKTAVGDASAAAVAIPLADIRVRANSLLLGGGTDFASTTARTMAATNTLLSQDGHFWTQRYNTQPSALTSSYTVGTTAPTGNWTFVAIEVCVKESVWLNPQTWRGVVPKAHGAGTGRPFVDQKPGSAGDLVFVRGQAVSGGVRVCYGNIDRAFAWTDVTFGPGYTIDYPGICQDTVNYDLHIIGQQASEVWYCRVRLLRDGDGHIVGLDTSTKVAFTLEPAITAWAPNTPYSVGAKVLVTDTSGIRGTATYPCSLYYICTQSGTSSASSAWSTGATGLDDDIVDGTVHWKFMPRRNVGYSAAIGEYIDANGVKRIAYHGIINTKRLAQPNGESCWVAMTTTAASGVLPTAKEHFVGLDLGYCPTRLFRYYGLPIDYTYDYSTTVARPAAHLATKGVELFSGPGLHGQQTVKYRVRLRPIADGTLDNVPKPDELLSYAGGSGGQQVYSDDLDGVWWVYEDGVQVRVSRVASSDVVTDPLPATGFLVGQPGHQHLAVQTNGAACLMMYPAQGTGNIRIHRHLPGAAGWEPYVQINQPSIGLLYQGAAGVTKRNDQWWTWAVVSDGSYYDPYVVATYAFDPKPTQHSVITQNAATVQLAAFFGSQKIVIMEAAQAGVSATFNAPLIGRFVRFKARVRDAAGKISGYSSEKILVKV